MSLNVPRCRVLTVIGAGPVSLRAVRTGFLQRGETQVSAATQERLLLLLRVSRQHLFGQAQFPIGSLLSCGRSHQVYWYRRGGAFSDIFNDLWN